MLALAFAAALSTLAGQPGEESILIGPTWVAIELGGTPVPLTPAERQPSVDFLAGGRVGGSDGCNRVSASYRLSGDRIRFGPIATTRKACPGTESLATRFAAALKGAIRFQLAPDRLRLYGLDGTLVAAFEARKGGGATAGEEPPDASPTAAPPPGAPATKAPLKSQIVHWAALNPMALPNGERRMVLDGPTATVDLLHVHATTLAVGQASGEPVRHPRDEVLIVKEGEVEVHLDGATHTAGPGAMLFFASGAVTRLRNIGAGPATYYVISYETPRTPKG